jgi:hypothetical protein
VKALRHPAFAAANTRFFAAEALFHCVTIA